MQNLRSPTNLNSQLPPQYYTTTTNSSQNQKKNQSFYDVLNQIQKPSSFTDNVRFIQRKAPGPQQIAIRSQSLQKESIQFYNKPTSQPTEPQQQSQLSYQQQLQQQQQQLMPLQQQNYIEQHLNTNTNNNQVLQQQQSLPPQHQQLGSHSKNQSQHQVSSSQKQINSQSFNYGPNPGPNSSTTNNQAINNTKQQVTLQHLLEKIQKDKKIIESEKEILQEKTLNSALPPQQQHQSQMQYTQQQMTLNYNNKLIGDNQQQLEYKQYIQDSVLAHQNIIGEKENSKTMSITIENEKMKNQIKDLQKIVVSYQNMKTQLSGDKVEQEDLIKLKNMLQIQINEKELLNTKLKENEQIFLRDKMKIIGENQKLRHILEKKLEELDQLKETLPAQNSAKGNQNFEELDFMRAKISESEEIQKQLILSKEQLVEDVAYWKSKCQEEQETTKRTQTNKSDELKEITDRSNQKIIKYQEQVLQLTTKLEELTSAAALHEQESKKRIDILLKEIELISEELNKKNIQSDKTKNIEAKYQEVQKQMTEKLNQKQQEVDTLTTKLDQITKNQEKHISVMLTQNNSLTELVKLKEQQVNDLEENSRRLEEKLKDVVPQQEQLIKLAENKTSELNSMKLEYQKLVEKLNQNKLEAQNNTTIQKSLEQNHKKLLDDYEETQQKVKSYQSQLIEMAGLQLTHKQLQEKLKNKEYKLNILLEQTNDLNKILNNLVQEKETLTNKCIKYKESKKKYKQATKQQFEIEKQKIEELTDSNEVLQQEIDKQKTEQQEMLFEQQKISELYMEKNKSFDQLKIDYNNVLKQFKEFQDKVESEQEQIKNNMIESNMQWETKYHEKQEEMEKKQIEQNHILLQMKEQFNQQISLKIKENEEIKENLKNAEIQIEKICENMKIEEKLSQYEQQVNILAQENEKMRAINENSEIELNNFKQIFATLQEQIKEQLQVLGVEQTFTEEQDQTNTNQIMSLIQEILKQNTALLVTNTELNQQITEAQQQQQQIEMVYEMTKQNSEKQEQEKQASKQIHADLQDLLNIFMQENTQLKQDFEQISAKEETKLQQIQQELQQEIDSWKEQCSQLKIQHTQSESTLKYYLELTEQIQTENSQLLETLNKAQILDETSSPKASPNKQIQKLRVEIQKQQCENVRLTGTTIQLKQKAIQDKCDIEQYTQKIQVLMNTISQLKDRLCTKETEKDKLIMAQVQLNQIQFDEMQAKKIYELESEVQTLGKQNNSIQQELFQKEQEYTKIVQDQTLVREQEKFYEQKYLELQQEMMTLQQQEKTKFSAKKLSPSPQKKEECEKEPLQTTEFYLNRIQELEDKLMTMHMENSQINSQNEDLTKEIENLQLSLDNTQQQIQDQNVQENEISELKNERASLLQNVESLTQTLHQQDFHIQKLSEEVLTTFHKEEQNYQQKLNELQSENGMLRNQLLDQDEFKKNNDDMENLLTQVNEAYLEKVEILKNKYEIVIKETIEKEIKNQIIDKYEIEKDQLIQKIGEMSQYIQNQEDNFNSQIQEISKKYEKQYQKNLELQIKEICQTFKEEKQTFQEDLYQREKDILQLKKIIDSKNASFTESLKKLENRYKQEINKLQEEIQIMKDSTLQLYDQQSKHESEKNLYQQSIKSLKIKMTEIENNFQSQVCKQTEELSEQSKVIEELQISIQGQDTRIEQLKAEKDRLQQENLELMSAESINKSEQKDLQNNETTEIEKQNTSENAVDNENAKLQIEQLQLEKSLQQQQIIDKIKVLQQDIEELTDQRDNYKQQAETNNQELTEKTTQLEEIKIQYENSLEKIQNLEQQMNQLKETCTQEQQNKQSSEQQENVIEQQE